MTIDADPLSSLRAAIQEVAGRDPGRVALDDGIERRSYGDLAERLFAAADRDHGARRVRVVESSTADVESTLAETFAGASLLLLDARTTAWERERVERLFVEAGSGRFDPQVLGLCSSGSSGLPKVVELEWGNLLSNAACFARAAGYGADDVLWCTTPLAHLYALGAGVIGGLLSGATVMLGKGMLEPAELAGLAASRKPTVLLSVPFLFRRYLKILESDPDIASGWSIRSAIAAGEPVPAELFSAWRDLTGTPLRSHYGLTEGGQITLAAGESGEGVGKPIEGVELRIGDGGEIAVRRVPPARPYAIVGEVPAADGWYETGDLGHLDEDGNLHVTGRADSRINVAGKKVDPAEVEVALGECEGVEDCAVAALEVAEGTEVVAFLRTCQGAPGDGAIRAELARRLSPHKLPRRFVRVAEIPRTLTGKVRRGQLIADLAAPGSPATDIPSRDLLQMVRTEAASVVLGHNRAGEIDAESTFKDLGFDSLAAVALCERLSLAIGLEVPPTAAFDHPSPSALAAHLAELTTDTVSSVRVARRPRFKAEPIAILGMACRYPGGVGTPAELWELAIAGRDAIGSFPADRGWDLERLYHPDPDHPATSYTREGGFLAGAGDFDAEFFGISPREALTMDPQQRLLLEAAWEALEDAGIDPASLRGSEAGVFAGVMSQDYAPPSAARGSSEGYLTTGLAEGVASGRIAFALGLEGPAVTINTACSSSLVATHVAAQALRLSECDLALAGGVTVMATPAEFIEFSRQRGLAPDGRCKAFAESADGTGFSEGVGLLVLERLSDAEANGHSVLATIRGSAVNQDGASNGLTAPNGPSQERVIRQALANARLAPADVDAVEAHGTGTTLGDPIEAGALLATYGQDRERPLRLGSLKSNIGHTQAAAGVAGVIKMVQSMREGVLPKTLHVDAPSSKVDWEAGKIELLTEPVQWQANGRPRRAGVSSFGISGTNAHLILEEAPSPAAKDVEAAGEEDAPSAEALVGPIPFALSAKSEPALARSAERLLAHLEEHPELEPRDVAHSLRRTRTLFAHRAVVLGQDREELIAALDSLARNKASAKVKSAKAKGGKLAYLFTGQGAQRAEMGKELNAASPLFAGALEEVCDALDPHLERPLRQQLFAPRGSEEAALLDRTAFTQPALFAIEVALFRLIEALGLRPDYLIGHSIGELVAAHLAGVLSLADAAKLVAARGALMGELPEGGAMIAIEASEAEVEEAIEGKEAELGVATINGPDAVVISGAEKAALEVAADFERRGRKTKRLAVSHAFHSPLIEPMLDRFAQVAEQLEYREPQIPIVSNLSAELLSPQEATDPGYWVAHARGAVRFADGVGTLEEQGVDTYLELGPDAVLSAMASACLPEGSRAVSIPTLRDGRGEPEALIAALAAVHVAGPELDFAKLYPAARRVPLPTYPFQRERYWLSAGPGLSDPASIGQKALDHPLLAARVEDPAGERLTLTGAISRTTHPWLADHVVLGSAILPGAAFLELALCAAEQVGAQRIEELTLQAPLLLPGSGAVCLQLTVSEPDEEGSRPISIHSRTETAEGEAEEWTLHASGSLSEEPLTPAKRPGAWPPQGAQPIPTEGLYERLADIGFEYGPAFQGLRAVWRAEGEIYAEISLPEERSSEAARFAIHPALLDASFRAGIGAAHREGEDAKIVPFQWSGVGVFAPGASSLRLRARVEKERLELFATDPAGNPIVQIDSLSAREVEQSQLQDRGRRDLFALEWVKAPRPQAGELSLAICGEQPIEGLAVEPRPDLAALLAEEDGGTEGGTPDVILIDARPWARQGEPVEASHRSAARGLELIQGLLAQEQLTGSRFAFLTQAALSTAPQEEPDLAQATLAGLLRSAASEHPGRIALIDADESEASLEALPEAMAQSASEPQLAIRDGQALAPRFAEAPLPQEGQAPCFDPQQTVLITGGLSGLGALAAHRLTERYGVRRLLLVSRSGRRAKGAEELERELTELGAEVQIAACDVAERKQLEELFAQIPEEHPLGAVIHAAGVVDNALIADLDEERLAAVMSPKADAAHHLHELSEDRELSAFILFSSSAGLLGGAGQGNYAAANAFLDALAQKRRAQGRAATSLAWGLWAQESNLAADLNQSEMERVLRQTRALLGFDPIPTEQGVELFDRALCSPQALLAPVRFDRAALRAQARQGTLSALLRGIVRVPIARQSAGESLPARLTGVPEAEREAFLEDFVRSHVAAVLGHDSAESIDPSRAFKELGFDSLAAVELRNRLQAAADLRLGATTVFDHPSCEKLARFLLERIGGGGDSGRATADVELDVLESKIARLSESERILALVRLRSLLERLSLTSDTTRADGDFQLDLDSASDEEVIQLIEEEFGPV